MNKPITSVACMIAGGRRQTVLKNAPVSPTCPPIKTLTVATGEEDAEGKPVDPPCKGVIGPCKT